MSATLRVFIGYDSREPIAYHVLSHSILSRASRPVSITPLALPSLRHVYTRERGPTESTEFSLTRFLVPYLSSYEGYSIFMDCDMLCRVDIGDVEVHVLANPGRAVYVCQHDYVPKSATKFLGHEQTAYPRKNWSSFMVFDNARCRKLTPDYVNAASGLDLHRFHWLIGGPIPGAPMMTTRPPSREWVEDDENDYIGSLPLDWNWLVGEYPANPQAKVLHWTNGGPWFPNYGPCDHKEDWSKELDHMMEPGWASASWV